MTYLIDTKCIYINMTTDKNSNPPIMSLHSFHKKFSLIRAFVDVGGNIKPCVICGNTATQEAIFAVDGAIIIEKYCNSCAKKNIK